MPPKTTLARTKAPARHAAGRILFRYRDTDTVAGVSRKTAARIAKELGLTETQVIHLALARLVQLILPRYKADDGPLSDKQLRAITKLEPRGRMAASDSLFL